MAKPGSRAAAALSGAVDLGKPRTSLDEQRIELERKAGMRCGGCKRRITLGFEFVTFVVVEHRGTADRLATARTYACSHEECDYATICAPNSNAMRPIEWAYPDEHRGEAITGAADPAAEFPVDGAPAIG